MLAVVDDGEVGEDDKENLLEVEKRLENEEEEEDPPSPSPPPPLPPPRLCFSSVASAAAHTVKHCPIFLFSPHHRNATHTKANKASKSSKSHQTFSYFFFFFSSSSSSSSHFFLFLFP
jgi:hypothetical protein